LPVKITPLPTIVVEIRLARLLSLFGFFDGADEEAAAAAAAAPFDGASRRSMRFFRLLTTSSVVPFATACEF